MISINRWIAIVLYLFRTMNDECGLDFANIMTYKLTRGKQNTCLTHRSLDETIATIDRCLKITGCRIVQCKQIYTNDKKSNNPLPHNTEKSVALVYYTLRPSVSPLFATIFHIFISIYLSICVGEQGKYSSYCVDR